MANVWVLMHNVEEQVDELYASLIAPPKTVTRSVPIRAFAQRATAFASLEKVNAQAEAHDADGNHQYYSLEEVTYV